jgi:hypothetical protein
MTRSLSACGHGAIERLHGAASLNEKENFMVTKNSNKTQTTETAKPPVAKLRIGLINANIWERTTDNGTFHSVSFERRYKDAKGQWASTHSYNTDDLLTLAKLADQAHTEIQHLRAGSAEDSAA